MSEKQTKRRHDSGSLTMWEGVGLSTGIAGALLIIAGLFKLVSWLMENWPWQVLLFLAAGFTVMFVWAVLNLIAILLILIFRP